MEASIDLNIKQSFVLKSEHIKHIIELLNNNIGNISISADCEDKINRKFNSVDQLLSYSNPPGFRIQSLSIRARSDDSDKFARVAFANESLYPIKFTAEATEDIVINLKDGFLKIITMTKAWYDRFAKLDIFGVMLLILYGMCIILILCIAIWGPNTPKSNVVNLRATAFGFLAGTGTVILFVLTGFLISKFRNKIFPIGTFAWGHGAENYEFLEKIRWTIVIGFIVSFLSGLVGSIIISLR